jgi:hypothetical protein
MMLHVCVCVVASIPFWETSAWRDFWQLLILVKTILVQFPPNGSIANSRRLSANLINWSKPNEMSNCIPPPSDVLVNGPKTSFFKHSFCWWVKPRTVCILSYMPASNIAGYSGMETA